MSSRQYLQGAIALGDLAGGDGSFCALSLHGCANVDGYAFATLLVAPSWDAGREACDQEFDSSCNAFQTEQRWSPGELWLPGSC